MQPVTQPAVIMQVITESAVIMQLITPLDGRSGLSSPEN
jgi:hypothetical protein